MQAVTSKEQSLSRPGWFTAEEELARQTAHEDALLHRYHNHLYLTRFDRREARRIIKARAAAAQGGVA